MNRRKRISSKGFVVVGDAIALLIFAYGGEVTHELNTPSSLVVSVLIAAFPFALTWFPTAYLARALAPRRGRAWFVQTAIAWLIAAPLGILVRSMLINRAVIPTAFLQVTYLTGFALFLGWRAMLILIFKIAKRNL